MEFFLLKNKVGQVNVAIKECTEPLTEIGGHFVLDLIDYDDLYTDAIKF